MSKLIAAVLMATFGLTCGGQQVGPLSKSSAAVKRKADILTPGAPISVVRSGVEEEFGSFVSSDQDGFTFHDLDRNTDVTLKYGEVRKIKDGYSGYNSIQRRHTDRTRGVIIAIAVVGGLAALVAAGAAAR